jgi:hypothetical protein
MAKILFVWELGKGFGHLAPYSDLVRELQGAGHNVIFAARDVGHTERIFGRHGVTILQAPIMMHNITNPYRVQYNFSHLLHNIGFGEVQNLFGLVKSWRHVYNYVRPDLALFDHSPTALLAAKPYPWQRIVSGSGFLVPPAQQPLPLMRYWQQYDAKKLAAEEAALLANINRVQEAMKQPPLAAVSELYRADAEILLSFRELDHYPMRGDGNYVGMFSPKDHGVAPVWPELAQKPPRRVFAYLHSFKRIADFLALLAQGNFATLVYAPEVPDAVKKKAANERLKFSAQPLDIVKVAADCNFAITNGTFGTTAGFIQYGKPVLAIPTNLERIMVAKRVVATGCGIAVHQDKPESLKPAIQAMFRGDKYRDAARRFAQQYRDASLDWQTARMMATINGLLATVKPGANDPVRASLETALPAAGAAVAPPAADKPAVSKGKAKSKKKKK